jgi:hypothetical protein
MRVEDPVNRRGGLILGLAFLSCWVLAGELESNLNFVTASIQNTYERKTNDNNTIKNL